VSKGGLSAMRRSSIVVSISLIAAATVSAQIAKTTKDKKASRAQIVEQVDIRGNRRISEADIRSWISTHESSAYNPRKLDRDVRALFNTGHFTDVKVSVQDGLHDGKIITFEVMDRPLIYDVAFEGIDRSQQAEVADEWRAQGIELSKGSEYDQVRVKRAAKIIQELLSERLGDNLKVMPYVEQRSGPEVSVAFKIEKSR